MDRTTIFVIGTSQQSGKTEAARRLAADLGLRQMSTSTAIAMRLEERLGIPPGTIAAARLADPETYRAELIAEGDAMGFEGAAAGVVALGYGARVIEGIRRVHELAAAIDAARGMGIEPVVVCVERPDMVLNDNTEADELRACADVVIANDGTLADFHARLDELAATLDAS